MRAIDPVPTETNAYIELHDSDLDGIDQGPNSLSLCLRAYVHRSNGQPGADPGTGWSQAATVTLSNGRLDTQPIGLPATIYIGDVRIGGDDYYLIPCPFARDADTSISLVFTNGDRLRITATGFTVAFSGEPEFVEDLPWAVESPSVDV
jgi:hypothetical protein